ncbi:MAG: radical SAM protein [Candidatus Aenigmatarchaeota archaeon]
MGICKICGKESELVSSFLRVCSDCIINSKESLELFLKAHEKSRELFGLTKNIPKEKNGIECRGCGNNCRIAVGMRGFCGLVENRENKLIRIGGTPKNGICEWYYDAHITNCVASHLCPGGTGSGYPKFAVKNGPEYGFYNLSVFYGSCNFNCLFCQNWHFRENTKKLYPQISSKELASKVNEMVSCICYFGGDPGTQLMHAIETSRIALERANKRILRVCIETNGNANSNLLKKFALLSLESGGNVKVDLKTFDERLSLALCGISNRKTLENFKMLSKYHKKREIPFLYASTLLIPGYVEVEEVRKISEFIAKVDKTIPYTILAFFPSFLMSDLPPTSKKVAEECFETAKECGLEKVRIGNIHLLK